MLAAFVLWKLHRATRYDIREGGAVGSLHSNADIKRDNRMTTLYDETQIKEKLADFPDWRLGDDGQLHAEYVFKNFSRAMLFANAVGLLAEQADHHPDLFIHDYRHVRISVMTHSQDAITDKDFALITQIDALPIK
jgi:4a-hydroxytetrahydrobiopterin dehydratase